jgi:hypothetical protein
MKGTSLCQKGKGERLLSQHHHSPKYLWWLQIACQKYRGVPVFEVTKQVFISLLKDHSLILLTLYRKHGEQRTPNRRNLNTPNKDQNTPGRNRNKARVNNILNNKRRIESGEKGFASPSRDFELRSKHPETTPVKVEKFDASVNTSAASQVEFSLKHVKRKIGEVGNIFKTDKSFYVPCEECNVSAKVVQSPIRKKRAKVEVPKWRFHPVSNCYALEGTENMEDEIYLKRHQKSETDEKRRKRWDIQRIREQRMYEKLKSGRYGASSPPKNRKNEIVTTFGPIPEEGK